MTHPIRSWDEVYEGDDLNIAYKLGGGDCIVSDGSHDDILVASGLYVGPIRVMEGDGEYHWRIQIRSPSGADIALRTSRIVSAVRFQEAHK